MKELTSKISSRNFNAFIWHASLLAIAKNFMDVDTVIPAMLLNSGGTQVHVGILTAILIGGSRLSQLFFAPMASKFTRKKPLLLTGINLRILSLAAIAIIFFSMEKLNPNSLIILIFIVISIFSLSGAFANIPFTDILGKSVIKEKRKQFFSLKQIISSAGIFASAFFVKEILNQHPYPENYTHVFGYAAGFLLLASLGFWILKEYIPSDFKKIKYNFKDVFKELKKDKKLQYYLLSINTLGLGYGILPFVLLYAGEYKDISSNLVGNLLLAKTIGLIIAGLWLYFRAKKAKYNTMMKSMIALGIIFPAIAWFFPNFQSAYFLSFFAGGVFISLYQIILGGVLLEISSTHNRSIYTGIAGAGSILPVIFPLFGGALISFAGFNAFFSLYSILMLTGIFFIIKLKCKQ